MEKVSKKIYHVDAQTLKDMLAFTSKNKNKRQVFIENTIRYVLDLPDLKDAAENDKSKEYRIFKAIDYCNKIVDALTEKGIDYRVMELPTSLYPYETQNNEPPFVELIPVVARSVKITMDDFNSFLKFIGDRRCICLYMVVVNENDKENDKFTLRYSLTIQEYLVEDAEFEELVEVVE